MKHIGRRRGAISSLFLIISITAIAFLTFIPGIGSAQLNNTTVSNISVVFIYGQKCAICEQARPDILKAIGDVENNPAIKVRYEEYEVGSKNGLEYVDTYSFFTIPVLIINDNTFLGPGELDGDPSIVHDVVAQKIIAASQYNVPVKLIRVIERNDNNATILEVKNSIKNIGNETINASFLDGIGNGLKIISGKAMWSGAIPPGETRNITYEAVVDDTRDKVRGPKLSYDDPYGFHLIPLPDDNIPPINKLDLFTVFLGGIVAGFNPCILAIMVFMATLAVSARGRKTDILTSVFAFCMGVLVIYLIIGIGLFEALNYVPSLENYLRYVISAVIFMLAAYSFYSVYLKYKGFDAGPAFRRWLGSMKPILKNYRLAGSFLTGALFGMVKMPCAGGIYLAILGRIILAKDVMDGLIYLLIYDMGIILPVLGLGILLTLGFGTERLDALRIRHAVSLNIITGLILVFLGAGFMLKMI